MKNILVVGLNMEIGGAERALLGLLESFDTEKYEVDLFLHRHVGEFMKYLPSNINLLGQIDEYTNLAVPLSSLLKKKAFSFIFARVYAKIRAIIFSKIKKGINSSSVIQLEYSHKYTKKLMPMISTKTYDLVISFCTPHYFGFEKTIAHKRIAWIHTDYSAIDIDVKSETKMWDNYDHIVSISDRCTESFITKMPTLANKIIRVDNIVTEDNIKLQANEFVPSEMEKQNDEIVLCSIGRFCNAKNFDNIPEICKLIIESGVDVKWYLIGYGGDENLILDKINNFKMNDKVIILGKKANPYPYIKACDIYVQPSRYEGKAVAVREAQILGKPVIITNFPTANSQLINNYDGIIIPMDNKECAKALVNIIKDKPLQKRLIANTKKMVYSNKEEINKIYSLIAE